VNQKIESNSKRVIKSIFQVRNLTELEKLLETLIEFNLMQDEAIAKQIVMRCLVKITGLKNLQWLGKTRSSTQRILFKRGHEFSAFFA